MAPSGPPSKTGADIDRLHGGSQVQTKKLSLEGPYAGLELAYTEWGPPEAEHVVVCVHGLTRNARDFDFLAAALAERGARVYAVDVVGRGASTWLGDPEGYALPNYAGQLRQFMELLELPAVDWIGTSMGGLIGMVLAAAENAPIRRLVLNDVGPFIPEPALKQIQSYLSLDIVFADLDEAERHLRNIHAPFGPLTAAQWRHLALHSVRETGEGLRLNYDPAIRRKFVEVAAGDIDLWELWDAVSCPTFLIRGMESALVSAETAAEMGQRGPKATVTAVPDVGHAPALMSRDQISTIERWLELTPAQQTATVPAGSGS